MIEPVEVEDDGLLVDEIGRWSLQKHRLIALYDTLFSTGMKNLWDVLIYMDLFCGPGRARIRDTDRIVETSPLIALRVPDPFARYIFCDREEHAIDALRQRVERDFPDADVKYHNGDCNLIIDEIKSDIPKPSEDRTVLSLAFLDPRGIGGLKFSTIKALSEYYVDFVLLLALSMDAHRFQVIYEGESNTTVDEFLGDATWRERWEESRLKNVEFRVFLVEEFAKRMQDLGYLPEGLETMKEIRSDEKNLSLYHIAFFSRNKKGYAFWRQVLKYVSPQLKLFD